MLTDLSPEFPGTVAAQDVMTPAILLLKKTRTPHEVHEYQHDASHGSFGLEAAEKMAVPAEQVFKTLVAEVDKSRLIVAILPVSSTLNLKKLAKAAGGKKAAMADAALVEKTTGYVLGGVSPLGQKKLLPTYLDASAANFEQIYVSAGRRGLEVALPPDALLALLKGRSGDLQNP
ncbi:Cys-tRNA(Pro)/Cys-tRNA(Cys) deacylase [Pseudohongiella nitratireducens]|uniref:Cys-tRNA(Pro)/Cys-tRNA(Cys) deacylase n=2 Tax=Pseudohongiella nitratireducens TaxID=1768907 RepID=A0A917GQS0_9GAMM|nr:Cys-tRNA(Pro)/Cys-tRNA(Cys) deacylase [Pseudohongiella nitratireducens]